MHGYLNLTGVNGDQASTDDSAGLDITGDLMLRFFGRAVDWGDGANQVLVAKSASGATTGGYQLRLNSAGAPVLAWSDGVTLFTRTGAVLPFTDGTDGGVWGLLDVDDGAAGHAVAFFTSTDGVNWAQHGTTITTAIPTSIAASTGRAAVGANTAGVQPFNGRCYFAEVATDVFFADTRANPDFRQYGNDITSFSDAQGNVWTVDAGAKIVEGATGLAASLNRMASTAGLDAAGAANTLAGTTGLELVGALNAAAGSTALEFNGAAKNLAADNGGDGSLDAHGALASVA